MNLPQSSPADSRVRSETVAIEAIYAAGHYLLTQQRVTGAAKVFRLMLKVAPQDERGWLGLGQCHEQVAQLHVAHELYGAGSVVTAHGGAASVRCLLARARVLRSLGRDAEDALAAADEAAAEQDDDELLALVAAERRRPS